MDPTEKGWLAKYLHLRFDTPISFELGNDWTIQKQIYKYLQPTGVIYGHPIELPANIKISTHQWPLKERLQVILFESLIATYCIVKQIKTPTDEILEEAVSSINQFYDFLYPNLLPKKLFGKNEKSDFRSLEKKLNKRVTVKAEWNAQFWKGFFHNILLFVDVILFLEFLKSPKTATSESIQLQSKDIQVHIIGLLATVFKTNSLNASQNSKFYNFFIESTNLSKEDKEIALNNDLYADNQELGDYLKNADWLLQKYFFELAVLSVWADLDVEASEILLLEELAEKLSFDPMDMEESTFAVESFVLLHWQQVHYLQSKQSYLVLTRRMTDRMTKISQKYGSQIKAEISENKELMRLLLESQKRPLSLDEKEKVRTQLIEILKSIPAFILLVMPMAFLTVPILMKILPRNIFPSSFDPNRMVNRRGNQIEEG